MNWSAIAAVFLALAVGMGAFGAHGLKARLDPTTWTSTGPRCCTISCTPWEC